MSFVDALAGVKSTTPAKPSRGTKTTVGVKPTVKATVELTAIGDLLAEPEEVVNWLVDGIIPAGAVCLLSAKPKVGKSTAARHLALAHARGEAWLGRQCTAGRVWYFAFEGRRRDMRSHFRQMGAKATDAVHVFVGQAPKNILAAVRERATLERPTLIIIDTMQRFLRAQSTDDYAEMTTLFDHVIGIAQHSGATLLLVHHSSKADRASIDAVLGSTAITGSVDNIILLTRSARYRTIATVQRIGDDLDERVLFLDAETGRLRLGPSREAADTDHVADALLSALEEAGEALPREGWFELVEARRTLKIAALRQLENGNQIQRDGAGTRNHPYRYRPAENRCSGLFPESGNNNSKNLPFDPFPKDSSPDSCSRIPAQEGCSQNESKRPNGEAEDDDDVRY